MGGSAGRMANLFKSMIEDSRSWVQIPPGYIRTIIIYPNNDDRRRECIIMYNYCIAISYYSYLYGGMYMYNYIAII